jgi:spectinomycin phosphotransferase
VRAPPEDLETSASIDALADAWGLQVEALHYAAVGGGSYHWVVNGHEGPRGFVTVDDLDAKPWLGDTRDAVFDGLRRAFDTAVALRGEGLAFVVAPIPTNGGEAVLRLGPRHTIALFPFVDGKAGRFGRYETAAERAAVVAMLAELHRATPAVASLVRTTGLDVPGRRHLEAGLRECNQTWRGGPFSEPARQALARHASDVAELLGLADRLAADVAARRGGWVVTHGEPHPGNVMRTGESHVLVDWDTVALAPAERDLWMVVDDSPDEAAVYADATGHRVDRVAMDFFRLSWDLDDLASFITVLRAPHRRNEDTEKAYEGVTICVKRRDRWAALLGEAAGPGRAPSRGP